MSATNGCDGPIKKVFEGNDQYEICMQSPTQVYIWKSKYCTMEVDLCKMCHSMLIRKGKDIVLKEDTK